jgi:hypothetical protein
VLQTCMHGLHTCDSLLVSRWEQYLHITCAAVTATAAHKSHFIINLSTVGNRSHSFKREQMQSFYMSQTASSRALLGYELVEVEMDSTPS